jgi:hypothetical protein
MQDRYIRNDSGMCINTDNAHYQHILNRRQVDARIARLEGEVGGIANSLNTIIEMMTRAEQLKLDRDAD